MRELVTGRQMKAIDDRSIKEYGIPAMVLMERAALAVADQAEEIFRRKNRDSRADSSSLGHSCNRADFRTCVVCGFGNNGADGVTAARILTLRGFAVEILLPGEAGEGRESEEFTAQLSIVKKLGIPVNTINDFIPGSFDLVIDAVFGTGLSRMVEGNYGALVDFIMEQKKEWKATVLSVDMPSGISAENGQILGKAVYADETVTFGKKKLGQALFPGRLATGKLTVEEIGFVPETEKMKAEYVLAYEPSDLFGRLPVRTADSHKGTWGKVLVIAGAKNMAGAAYFSALSAYRTGAGLVKILTVEENRTILQARLPEALLSTYDADWAGEYPEDFKAYIKEEISWADVIVLGPGLGRGRSAKDLVEAVLSDAYVPIVLDADALNLAAEWPHLKGYFTENIIVTPHVKEMERLTGKTVEEIKAAPVKTAAEFSGQYGLTCVLKDAATVIARKDGKIFVNESGSPAMAKGGSGDVLTGILAGLLAMGCDDCEAASLGVYIHGLCGEAAEKRHGIHSALAGELAESIGEVLGNFGKPQGCGFGFEKI